MKGKHIAVIASILIFALIITMGRLFLVRSVEISFDRQPVYVNEADIVSASNIKFSSNIFSINESEIKKNVSNFYGDNSVSVIDVERVFPNKVIIYAKERFPILFVKTVDGRYIPTDIDFQLNKVAAEDFDGQALIAVSGIEVDLGFNATEFREIRKMLCSFLACGLKAEGLAVFFEEIKVSSESYTFLLREGGSAFEITRTGSLEEKCSDVYEEFLDYLSEGDIFGLTLKR